SMEAFIKEARTSYGSTYDVTGSTGNNEVSFVNQDGNCVAFRVNGGVFQRADIGSVATCDPGAFTPNKFSPLTGSQTNISAIHFNIVPAQVVNNKLANQGVITINMTAQSASSDVLPIQLENTIVSRQMNPYVQQ
ncbi:MAG TPA: hypothetical protein VLG69_01235, partial [Candidatus Andersenbacteria bacterium]|nr:hypothetical protein [Candidatus Andersenbacteria bacterium]